MITWTDPYAQPVIMPIYGRANANAAPVGWARSSENATGCGTGLDGGIRCRASQCSD